MGTLVGVGLGRLSLRDVTEALARKGRVSGGGGPIKAPARGLCLDRCFYGPANGYAGAWGE